MVDEIELSQDPPTHPMVGPLSDPRDRHAVSKPQALLLSTDEKAKNEKVRLESASKERMAEEAARYLPQVVLVEDSDADGEDEEDKGQGEGEGEGEGKAGPRTKASPKPGLDPKDSCAYELRGAILHRGSSPQSGHYVSLMSIASDRTWWCFNDEQVERVSIKRVLNEISSEGYILFYSKS